MPTLSLKVGPVEVSYEGDQAFIESGLLKLVKELAVLPIAQVAAAPAPQNAHHNSVPNGGGGPATVGGTIGHTTSQIAHSLGVSSGGDLALAAAAHLILSNGQETITRSDIFNEMKGATAFVTASYLKNLTPTLNGLVKNKKLTPISKDKYSMPSSIRTEISLKLANE